MSLLLPPSLIKYMGSAKLFMEVSQWCKVKSYSLLDVPCVVWRTRCLMLETEGSHECWPIFQLNSPWHSSVHDCIVRTLVVVTGISPSSVQFTSKKAKAWACAKMWICKNCHLALLYYNKVFEPNGRFIVVDCNAIVHLALYLHQAFHTDIVEN